MRGLASAEPLYAGTSKPWDAAFPACVAYQGCNPLYPVVWCQTSGMGHSNGGMYSSKGFWKFWSSLSP
jgi:hypothetical protein